MVENVERHEEDIDDLLGDSPRSSRAAAARRPRELAPRQGVEDRGLDDDEDEKFELFAQQLFNGVLPDLPPIPGYHVCWLSTTHQADTIPKRMQLGYSLIKAEEIPGFEHATLRTGEYAGCVGVNEMIAAKISDRLYQRFMHEAHYAEPLRQVQAIEAKVNALKAKAERDGGRIDEDEGMADIHRAAPAPKRFS